MCRVQQLSLRYNGITDVGAQRIGSALGDVTQQNQKLLSLNLAGNKIADVGAHHLAEVRSALHRVFIDIGVDGKSVSKIIIIIIIMPTYDCTD